MSTLRSAFLKRREAAAREKETARGGDTSRGDKHNAWVDDTVQGDAYNAWVDDQTVADVQEENFDTDKVQIFQFVRAANPNRKKIDGRGEARGAPIKAVDYFKGNEVKADGIPVSTIMSALQRYKTPPEINIAAETTRSLYNWAFVNSGIAARAKYTPANDQRVDAVDEQPAIANATVLATFEMFNEGRVATPEQLNQWARRYEKPAARHHKNMRLVAAAVFWAFQKTGISTFTIEDEVDEQFEANDPIVQGIMAVVKNGLEVRESDVANLLASVVWVAFFNSGLYSSL